MPTEDKNIDHLAICYHFHAAIRSRCYTKTNYVAAIPFSIMKKMSAIRNVATIQRKDSLMANHAK